MTDIDETKDESVRGTTERRRAMGRLRGALTALDKAGLCVYGMDRTLHVHVRDAVDARTEFNGGDNYEARRTDDDAECITHRAYRDSGGW